MDPILYITRCSFEDATSNGSVVAVNLYCNIHDSKIAIEHGLLRLDFERYR